MPKAYIISDVTLRNNDAAKAYREAAAELIVHHGGRYLVRGGEVDGAGRRVASENCW